VKQLQAIVQWTYRIKRVVMLHSAVRGCEVEGIIVIARISFPVQSVHANARVFKHGIDGPMGRFKCVADICYSSVETAPAHRGERQYR
jgi:hypothetical protein